MCNTWSGFIGIYSVWSLAKHFKRYAAKAPDFTPVQFWIEKNPVTPDEIVRFGRMRIKFRILIISKIEEGINTKLVSLSCTSFASFFKVQ